jgi:NADPH:quinone reductase-like Zn-dependent oxidoreductase
MDTAKVVRLHALGGPEVLQLEELPLQQPSAGEVRLKVQAVGLNRAEVMFRTGHYLEQPEFPSRIGIEAAGIVDAVGSGVTQVKIGQKVSVTTSLLPDEIPVLLVAIGRAATNNWPQKSRRPLTEVSFA